MSLQKQIEVIIQIDALIRSKTTGTPKELAKALNMSERNLYKIIKAMKNLGAPIKYCKKNGRFLYTKEVEFKIFNSLY